MEKYKKTIEELKKEIKKQVDITVEQWDKKAKEEGLFGSIMIKTRFHVDTWEEVKQKLNIHKANHLNKKIEVSREKLGQSIEKYGWNAKETKENSIQITNLLNIYYKNNRNKIKGRYYKEENKMAKAYNRSYEYMKSIAIKLDEFPTIKEWNTYAKEKRCLSSKSIQYISGYNWHQLRDKIKTDIHFKSYGAF